MERLLSINHTSINPWLSATCGVGVCVLCIQKFDFFVALSIFTLPPTTTTTATIVATTSALRCRGTNISRYMKGLRPSLQRRSSCIRNEAPLDGTKDIVATAARKGLRHIGM